MNKKDLQDKLINLDYFFRLASRELKRKMGFKRITFLVPDGKNGDFVANNSPFRTNIRLTNKELYVINDDLRKDIYYLKSVFRSDHLLNRFLLIKIKWKLWLYGITAIMPIYYDGEFVCLILFKDRLVDSKLKKNYHCINIMRQEITYCLESILLYNS